MKKGLSVRTKITLWFSAALSIMVVLTFLVILYVSSTVVHRMVSDNLIKLVKDNVDEVEYFNTIDEVMNDDDTDLYIPYNEGALEIDDDFLDEVNGIATALYTDKGELLYGKSPVPALSSYMQLTDGHLQSISVKGIEYFVFDRKLTNKGLDGLWLRGTVPKHQEDDKLSSVAVLSLIGMPLLLIFAVLGGYIIAGRVLRPIKYITETATKIYSGRDLKKRIAIESGNDELHMLANTFDEMFDRLEQSFETEAQFTSDVSHELRTPISVIRAQCEYTLDGNKSLEEYKEALGVISRQSKKMSKIIEDMLNFTRLETKAEFYQIEPLNFSTLTASICEDLAMLHEKNITLICEVENDIIVNGNQELLSRLIINLISNAYRYGNENGHINVKLKRHDKMALLIVSDNGIGMTQEQIDKIFNRFYQADSSRNIQGTGLGLSMAKEIAQLHKSNITVESELGKGSKFIFKIHEKI